MRSLVAAALAAGLLLSTGFASAQAAPGSFQAALGSVSAGSGSAGAGQPDEPILGDTIGVMPQVKGVRQAVMSPFGQKGVSWEGTLPEPFCTYMTTEGVEADMCPFVDFEVQYSTTPDMANPASVMVSHWTVTFAVPAGMGPGRYYVRVRAGNDYLKTGPWSRVTEAEFGWTPPFPWPFPGPAPWA